MFIKATYRHSIDYATYLLCTVYGYYAVSLESTDSWVGMRQKSLRRIISTSEIAPDGHGSIRISSPCRAAWLCRRAGDDVFSKLKPPPDGSGGGADHQYSVGR